VDSEAVLALRERRQRRERSRPGRRLRSPACQRTGKYARPGLAAWPASDIAVDATLRAAALRSRQLPLRVLPPDLRRKLRRHRAPFAACFLVDNSWSVHAERMVEKVKGVVLRLLEETAGRGDRVALVAFRGGVAEATVALPFTASATLAERRLRSIPLSGQTPLADALRRARRLFRQQLAKEPGAVPLLVVVTDGEPTAPLRRGGDPLRDALAEARALRQAGILLVVVDASRSARGCAPELARVGGGVCFSLADLAPQALLDVLQEAAA
jgi:magnesium chelatase subunit D